MSPSVGSIVGRIVLEDHTKKPEKQVQVLGCTTFLEEKIVDSGSGKNPPSLGGVMIIL